MDIYITWGENTLEIECKGHTDTEYCNAISTLMWSFLAWAANYAEETHDFEVGHSRIRVKTDKTAVFDFMDTALRQIALNNKGINLHTRYGS